MIGMIAPLGEAWFRYREQAAGQGAKVLGLRSESLKPARFSARRSPLSFACDEILAPVPQLQCKPGR